MMCTVCGCGEGETRIEGESADHEHPHEHGHTHGHDHNHDHHHPGEKGDLHFGKGAGACPMHRVWDQARMVAIEQDILGKNDQYAAANRSRFAQLGVLAPQSRLQAPAPEKPPCSRAPSTT